MHSLPFGRGTGGIRYQEPQPRGTVLAGGELVPQHAPDVHDPGPLRWELLQQRLRCDAIVQALGHRAGTLYQAAQLYSRFAGSAAGIFRRPCHPGNAGGSDRDAGLLQEPPINDANLAVTLLFPAESALSSDDSGASPLGQRCGGRATAQAAGGQTKQTGGMRYERIGTGAAVAGKAGMGIGGLGPGTPGGGGRSPGLCAAALRTGRCGHGSAGKAFL